MEANLLNHFANLDQIIELARLELNMFTSKFLRQQFLDFMASKGCAILPSAPVVPKEDPTVLFNSAGMQPVIPYLLGKPHPLGTRLANSQKCIRTNDIEEVGDNRHVTFVEMLGHWSLGDYFKKEAVQWSWELLTDPKWLNLNPARIFVTVYRGSPDGLIPADEEAIKYWQDCYVSSGLKPEVSLQFDFGSAKESLSKIVEKNFDTAKLAEEYQRAVAVIRVQGTDKYLIYHRNDDFYRFLGGHIEAGETVYDATIREIQEETGLNSSQIKFQSFITSVDHSWVNSHELHVRTQEHYYLFEITQEVFKIIQPEGTLVIEAKTMKEILDITPSKLNQVILGKLERQEFDSRKEDFVTTIRQMKGGDNWWGLPYRGPCGPCSEMYYLLPQNPTDFGTSLFPLMTLQEIEDFVENQIIEIGNNVFMGFEGEKDDNSEPVNLIPLTSKNIDTGLGFDRFLTVINGYDTIYQTDTLAPIIDVIDRWKQV